MSSRLVLSYVKEGAVHPDFCEGHSPAVTITFVCPSERREVSGLSERTPQWREHKSGQGWRRTHASVEVAAMLPGTDSGARAWLAVCGFSTTRRAVYAKRMVFCSRVE